MINTRQLYSQMFRVLKVMLAATLLLELASVSAQTPTITEYPIPTSYFGPGPSSIANGPDGNLWFTLSVAPVCFFDPCPLAPVDAIGRITPAGVATQFAIPTPSSEPADITAGPDGNLWFTEQGGNNIGVVTPAGVITEYPIPTANSSPVGIAKGPDGNLWFTESGANNIARITPAGAVTEFPGTTGFAHAIASGPDGNLWFTEFIDSCDGFFCEPANAMIGRIAPDGVISEFPLPTGTSSLYGIASGPDGNLWFTENNFLVGDIVGGKIGRATPSGAITEFTVSAATAVSSYPQGITNGPDGNLWFTDSGSNGIGQITPAGLITEYPIPAGTTVGLYGITTGPDGNIWFTQSTDNQSVNEIGKMVTGTGISISAGFTGNWFDTSESGHGFSIEVLPGNQMLAQWYVFAPNGGQSWIVATGPITGNSAVLQGFQPIGPGGRFPPNFNGSNLQNQPWGTISFTFTDCNNGTVSWQPTAPGYASGSLPISRLTMPMGLTCP
jgi:streptogramin lyase